MALKKLKILHLLSQRPDSTGSGYYIQAMVKESEKNLNENFLVAGLHSKDKPQFDFISDKRTEFIHFNGHDISYQIVGMSDVMPYESKRFCDLTDEELVEYETTFISKLKNVINEYRPDIIHSHHLWILTSVVKQNFPEIPLVALCHGSDLRQFRKCIHLREMVLTGCSQVEAVLALSEMQKNDICELYKINNDKIFVVGAGYNDRLFKRSEKPYPDPVELVYAGKLSRSKGVPWMLKALKRISSINWELHLVGSGTGYEKDECLSLVKELGKNVTIHGAVHQSELAEIMNRSHIFILPSFFEGLPLVILEALASGNKVIATDLPGVREISKNISDKNLKVVDLPRMHSVDQPYKEDEDRFVEDLSEIIDNTIYEVRKDPEVKEEGIILFKWNSVFEKVQKIYHRVIEK